MKIRALYFHVKGVYVGVQATSVDGRTHDIRLGPQGFFVVEHRASKKTFLVHGATCSADVDMEGDDEEKATKKGKAA